MVKKKENMVWSLKNSVFLVLLIVGLIIAGIIVLLNEQEADKFSVIQTSPTPREQEYPFDVENDGIYTNHKYKFAFRYPSDIFDTQAIRDPKLNDPDPWDYQSWGRSIDGNLKGKKFVYFSVRTEAAKGMVGYPALHDYEESMKVKPGSTFLNGNGTKLKNYDRGNVKGSVFYFKVLSGVLYEFPAYMYSAEFYRDGKLYVLQMLSNDYQTLLNYRKTFDGIVDSFGYIE